MVEGARVHGAARIIGIDINDSKHKVAEAFGMTDFINPKNLNSDGHKSISELVKQLTGGSGVDFSFECTGVAHLVNEALESTKAVSSTAATTMSTPCVCVLKVSASLISALVMVVVVVVYAGNRRNDNAWSSNREKRRDRLCDIIELQNIEICGLWRG